jgi:tetratricopeptide (TPR) repeat protein
VNLIQTHIKHLRKLLDPGRKTRTPSDVLPRVGDGYALRVPADAVDLARFRSLVSHAATDHRAGGDPRRAVTSLGEALTLWQGPPLGDVASTSGHPKVVAVLGERHAAVARYGEALIANGAAADGLPILERAAAEQPLDEAVQALLIRAYQAAGRRAQAFTTYHETRGRLAEDLGVEPGPELTAAHDELLRQAVRSPATRNRAIPAQLPADVYAFTGRTGELLHLDSLVPATADAGPSTAVLISAVAGAAGVGKTALAVRWAHRVRDRFPDGQLHIDLRGYDHDHPVPANDALAGFLRALGVPSSEIPLDMDERAACYRTLLDGRRMLVLLDNASSVEQVRPLLPGTSACLVVVTSRDSLSGLVARHGARRLDLDVLPPGDAFDLLRRLIGPRVDAEPAAAATLAEQCARLPLAVRVAADLAITRRETSLASLVEELTDYQRRLDLLDAGGDPRTAVRAVFSWSYQHLSEEAARAFRLMSLHPGAGLDPYAVAALTATTDVPRAGRILELLAGSHLVQRIDADRYGMHDLLRAYGLDVGRASDPEPERAAALIRLLDFYLYTASATTDLLFPGDRHRRPRLPEPPTPTPRFAGRSEALAWMDRERPSLVAISAHAAGRGWPAHAVRLGTVLSRYLDSGGHYADAFTIYAHALRAAQQTGDLLGEATISSNVGHIHLRRGDNGPAAEHYQRALDLFRAAGDDLGLARTQNNIGNVLLLQGDIAGAAEHYRQAAILHRTTGDRVGEGRALTNLAAACRALGQYSEAVQHGERSLCISRELDDRDDEAHVLDELGQVHLRLGHHEQAVDHVGRALDVYREAGNPLGEAYALGSLAAIRLAQGTHEPAIANCEQALALFRRLGVPNGEAEVLSTLAGLDLARGRHTEAAGHYRQSVSLHRQSGNQSGEAIALNGLGGLLVATGDIEQAHGTYSAALAVATAVGDPYERGRAHAGLAQVLRIEGDLPAARRNWEQALHRFTHLGVPEAEGVRMLLAARH